MIATTTAKAENQRIRSAPVTSDGTLNYRGTLMGGGTPR
jgi:hypothetical protein